MNIDEEISTEVVCEKQFLKFCYFFPNICLDLQLSILVDTIQKLFGLVVYMIYAFPVAEASITPLGKAMACFPVSPRYAKMLALGHQHNLLPYVVVIVSVLSVQELFVEIYSSAQDDKVRSTEPRHK